MISENISPVETLEGKNLSTRLAVCSSRNLVKAKQNPHQNIHIRSKREDEQERVWVESEERGAEDGGD